MLESSNKINIWKNTMYVDKRLSCIRLFLDKQNVIIHNGICCSKLQTPPRHHIIMLSHMKMYSMHINSTTFRWMPWKLATSPHHYLTETRIISHGDGVMAMMAHLKRIISHQLLTKNTPITMKI